MTRTQDIFDRLQKDALQRVSTVADGLLDQFGQIQPHIIQSLTKEEESAIEEIIGTGNLIYTNLQNFMDYADIPVVFGHGVDISAVPAFFQDQQLLTLPKAPFKEKYTAYYRQEQ